MGGYAVRVPRSRRVLRGGVVTTTHAEALAEIERAQAARAAWLVKWPNANAYSDGYDEGVTDREIYEG